jgi:hypothetical protein
MTLALGPSTVPDQPMSYALLVTVYAALGILFLVKCFLAGLLATIGFALANRWFKLGIRGPAGPAGEMGYSGMQGPQGEPGVCQCGTSDAKLAHLAVSHKRLTTEVERMKRDLGQR